MRHGHPALTGVYLGSTDCSLSVDGRLAAAGAVSVHGDWDLIVSSPLQRCSETARWLAERSGIELMFLSELQEYHFGRWDGKTFEEVYEQDQQYANQFWSDPESCPPPGGETIKEFSERVNHGLHRVLEHPAQNPLIITHGGVIRLLVAEILGIEAQRWSKIKTDYAHFTQLRFDYVDGHCWSQLINSNIKHPQTLDPPI